MSRPISRISFRGFSEDTEKALRSRMPIHEGALLSDELLQASIEVAKTFNERLQIYVAPALSREAVNVTVYDPATVPQRIRIEGSVQDSRLVEKVGPIYPPRSEEDTHETGVQLAVVVGKDGMVKDVHPLAGPDLLMDAAIDAVKRWRYRPTLLNGIPVEVQTTVEVSFTRNR